MEKLSVKKICILALLISFASILSYLDLLLSNLICSFLPLYSFLGFGIKLGIANIVIMFIIYKYSFVDSLISVFLKSIIIGFIFGNLINFIIGFVGTIFSFFTIQLLKSLLGDYKLIPFVSSIGGLMHMIGQLLVVFIIYSINNLSFDFLLLYLTFDLLFGLLTGLIIGFLSKSIIKKFN